MGEKETATAEEFQRDASTSRGIAGPEPEEATNLNSSRSNVTRTVAPGTGGEPPTPIEASNLNLSKSNINRLAGGDPAPGDETSTGHPRA